jgi:hypothetical protein
MRKEYLAAVTHGGAKFFIHKVALMALSNRVALSRGPGPRASSLFRLPAPRHWVADPISTYRCRPGR